MKQRSLAVLTIVALALPASAAEAPSWPCFQGPNSNFSATDCGLTLVHDLAHARLLWKSQEPTPPGAAQSPRYGGHAWHRISLGDFKPIAIPLAGTLAPVAVPATQKPAVPQTGTAAPPSPGPAAGQAPPSGAPTPAGPSTR